MRGGKRERGTKEKIKNKQSVCKVGDGVGIGSMWLRFDRMLGYDFDFGAFWSAEWVCCDRAISNGKRDM